MRLSKEFAKDAMTAPDSEHARSSKARSGMGGGPARSGAHRRDEDEDDEVAREEKLEPEVRRRRGRSWRRLFGVSALLAAGIVAIAPWLLTQFGLVDRLLRSAPLPGSLTIGRTSLAWWSPVALDDIELRDAQGQLMAKIDHVASDKTLFSLALARTDLGKVVIQHPRLLIETRLGGSNVEDFIQAMHLSESSSPGGLPALPAAELDIVDGEILIEDSLTKRQSLIGGVKLAVRSSPVAGSLDATLSAQVTDDSQVTPITGRLHAESLAMNRANPATQPAAAPPENRSGYPMGDAPAAANDAPNAANDAPAAANDAGQEPSATPDNAAVEPSDELATIARAAGVAHPAAPAGIPLAVGNFELEIAGAPLALVQPLVARAFAGAQVDGQLVAKLSGSWGGGADHSRQSLDVDLVATNAQLLAPGLGTDRLQMTQAHLPCRITRTGSSINVEQLALNCDVGQFTASGQLDVANPTTNSPVAFLARQSFQVSGQCDLAKLAKLLPATLRIRQGVEITAGQVTMSASGAPAQGGGAWQARVEGANLTATNNGQQFAWQEPFVVELAGHDAATGPIVDTAKLDASFLHAQASGAADNLSGSATFDLAKLASEAAQFIDLDSLQLAGAGSVTFAWQQAADQTFALRANIDAKNLQVALPGRPAWIEPSLSGELDVRGLAAGFMVERLDRASLDMLGNQERLLVALAQPANDLKTLAWNGSWQGPLQSWTGRLALWIDVAGWELTGQGALSGQVIVTSDAIAFQQISLKAEQAHVWLPGVYFDEQQLTITTAGAWDRASIAANSEPRGRDRSGRNPGDELANEPRRRWPLGHDRQCGLSGRSGANRALGARPAVGGPLEYNRPSQRLGKHVALRRRELGASVGRGRQSASFAGGEPKRRDANPGGVALAADRLARTASETRDWRGL